MTEQEFGNIAREHNGRLKALARRFSRAADTAIDEEDIAAYRNLASALVVPTSNPFYGTSPQMTSLLQRFSDGQLSADQFVKEFSRIYQMIEMENQ